MRSHSVGINLGSTRKSATPAKNVVNRNRAGAEENQGEGDGGGGQRELVSGASGRTHESVVQMYFPDRDREIYAYRKGSRAGEESDEHRQATEQFRECRHIAQPRR